MLENIYDLLTLLVAYICMLFIAEFVFLEPKFKYQKDYSFGAMAVICMAYFVFGMEPATILLCVSIGLYVSLSRQEKRIRGFFSCLPILGICDGLFVPVLNVAQLIFCFSPENHVVFGICIYLVMAVAVGVLWIDGKKWRENFGRENQSRRLARWERNLLYIIGILLCFTSMQLADSTMATNLDSVMMIYVITNSVIAFILTITIIVLVMQGNKKTHYHQQVSQMQYNIIITMADMIENRDQNTGGHIKRTARYVELIARKLREQGKYTDILTDRYISDIIIAAPLHDMGKIHVSDLILNKPGRLTEEEFEAMKSHTTAGRDMLMQAEKNLGESSYLDIAVEMAGYHHEWWNGKGYPGGICGQDIPLCARIMAVADVFDALISKRCYKDAMSLDKAYDIIRQETGTHFEPDIVEAFFAAREEIEATLEIS